MFRFTIHRHDLPRKGRGVSFLKLRFGFGRLLELRYSEHVVFVVQPLDSSVTSNVKSALRRVSANRKDCIKLEPTASVFLHVGNDISKLFED